jgi:hypothetical protein
MFERTETPKKTEATDAQLARARKEVGIVDAPAKPAAPVPATLKNAIKLVHEKGVAYAFMFRDAMGISYEESAHMLDALEKAKVIGPEEGLVFHGYGYRRVYNQQPGGVG